MAITGNPGDLATGGFGTGSSGLAATSRDLANAVARQESMAAARQVGQGSNIGGGFRGPIGTWGSPGSIVPGSMLARIAASPLAPYGGMLNVTQDDLIKAALANASLLGTDPMNPSLFQLKNMAAKVQESPELQGVLGSIYGPFIEGASPSVPADILSNAINEALPSPKPLASNTPTIPSFPSAPFNRAIPPQEPAVPQFTFGNPADSLASYGWMFDNPSLPIGMRNFNPGNLKYTGSDWQQSNLFGIVGPSKYTDQGDPQIQFSDPVSGMASAARLALAKQSQGMDTVREIIANPNGWTPGNTVAANNIARTMGVSPTQPIDLKNPATMDSFLKALVKQEHGPDSSQYGQDVYNAGINVAFNAYGLDGKNIVAEMKEPSPQPSPGQPANTGNNITATISLPAYMQRGPNVPESPIAMNLPSGNLMPAYADRGVLSPAQPTAPAPVVANRTPTLPPRTPTPGLLSRMFGNLTGQPLYQTASIFDTQPNTSAYGDERKKLASTLLAAAQPTAPTDTPNTTTEADMVNKPTEVQPVKLSSSLLPDWYWEWYKSRGLTGGLLG